MKMFEVPFYLFQFPCEQCYAGESVWLKKFLATTNMLTHSMPDRIHCKTVCTSARLVFETRVKCQDCVARFKDDGLPCTVDSPFRNTSATVMVRQSKSPEDRETGKRFAPLWKALSPKIREVFPDHDSEGDYIVVTIDFRAKVLNVYDSRSGIGKPVFRLDPVGREQKVTIISPGLCAPHITDDVLQQVVDEASTPAQDHTAHM